MKWWRVTIRIMHNLTSWHFCGWFCLLQQPLCSCAPTLFQNSKDAHRLKTVGVPLSLSSVLLLQWSHIGKRLVNNTDSVSELRIQILADECAEKPPRPSVTPTMGTEPKKSICWPILIQSFLQSISASQSIFAKDTQVLSMSCWI